MTNANEFVASFAKIGDFTAAPVPEAIVPDDFDDIVAVSYLSPKGVRFSRALQTRTWSRWMERASHSSVLASTLCAGPSVPYLAVQSEHTRMSASPDGGVCVVVGHGSRTRHSVIRVTILRTHGSRATNSAPDDSYFTRPILPGEPGAWAFSADGSRLLLLLINLGDRSAYEASRSFSTFRELVRPELLCRTTFDFATREWSPSETQQDSLED